MAIRHTLAGASFGLPLATDTIKASKPSSTISRNNGNGYCRFHGQCLGDEIVCTARVGSLIDFVMGLSPILGAQIVGFLLVSLENLISFQKINPEQLVRVLLQEPTGQRTRKTPPKAFADCFRARPASGSAAAPPGASRCQACHATMAGWQTMGVPDCCNGFYKVSFVWVRS